MCCQPGGILCQSPAAIEPAGVSPATPIMATACAPSKRAVATLDRRSELQLLGAERAQRAGAPAGLLVGLADRSLPGRLAGLDAPGGDLPASGVGDDEAVDKAGPGAGTGHRAIVASRWTLVERRGRGDGIR
jgi:hypothetical protein